jgi:flagellar protein FliJ
MSRVSNMKSRENAFRLKRFEAEDKRRKVAALEQMIREFEHMAAELDRQVQSEEDRTGVKDRSHFAYSTLAKAAAQRRDNLRTSVTNLQSKLEVAMRERNDLCADLDASPPAEQQSREFGRLHSDHQAGA